MSNEQPTPQDLVAMLWENIQRLRNGEATPAVANATTGSAATLLRHAKLQMDHAKMRNETPDIALLRGQ